MSRPFGVTADAQTPEAQTTAPEMNTSQMAEFVKFLEEPKKDEMREFAARNNSRSALRSRETCATMTVP